MEAEVGEDLTLAHKATLEIKNQSFVVEEKKPGQACHFFEQAIISE